MKDPMMRVGGCAALCAIDTCLLRAMYFEEDPEPLLGHPLGKPPFHLTREEYRALAMEMKPYLRPRWGGVSELSTYMDGLNAFRVDRGLPELSMKGFPMTESAAQAEKALREQIDSGLVVPCLILYTKQRSLKFYEWHWFLLNGYRETPRGLEVKATTYGSWRWLPLDKLWDTGHPDSGGLILYEKG